MKTSTGASNASRGFHLRIPARCGTITPLVSLRSDSRRLFDQPSDLVRVRDEGNVARADLDGLRAYALRVESLEIGIDGPVLRRDQVERRNRLPRRVRHG